MSSASQYILRSPYGCHESRFAVFDFQKCENKSLKAVKNRPWPEHNCFPQVVEHMSMVSLYIFSQSFGSQQSESVR